MRRRSAGQSAETIPFSFMALALPVAGPSAPANDEPRESSSGIIVAPAEAPARLMTLSGAARYLGIPGRDPARSLKRHLQRVEAALGQRIMWRVGSGHDRGLRYRVTDAAIRQHCPELFDGRDRSTQAAADREVQRLLTAIEDRLREFTLGALSSLEPLVAAKVEEALAERMHALAAE